MKKHIFQTAIKAIPMMFVTSMVLTACQSEQEIGTPLYPVQTDDNAATAYIDNRIYNPKNFMSTTFSQAGTSPKLVIPNDTLKFKVQLTAPAEKDFTFKLRIDNSKIQKEQAQDHAMLDADAVKMQTETVVIKQGNMQSEEPFAVVLNEASKALMELKDAEKGVVALTIESADGVKISEKYNTYCWEVNKKVDWVDPNGSVEKLQMVDVNSYEVNSGFYGDAGPELSDSNFETFARYMISDRPIDLITVKLNEPIELSALQLTPCGKIGWQDLSLFFCKEIEVQGSLDGENFQHLGRTTNPKQPASTSDVWNVVFYAPQKVKHIRIRTFSTFASSQERDMIFLSELRLFK